MWVQAYRIGKQLYDNTNNGIEAQNKAFKYSFLNCCCNLLMSRLIYLLVDIFVPAQTSKVRITHRIISFGQPITVALQKSILYEHSISDMLH